MLIFALNTFLCVIKLLIFSWFTNDQIFLKIVILSLLLLGIKLVYGYPKVLPNDVDIIVK